MSGLAGAFDRKGQTVSRERLERLSTRLSHRGLSPGFWRSGPVGLVSDSPLAFDGRLDNRAALEEILGPGSDSELVQRAYRRWGDRCPAHLLGDFAFALWDDTRQRLFCARDFLGVRPFHFYLDSGLFLFASEIAPLLGEPEVPHRPNEGVVAEYLAFSHGSAEETLYAGIERLAAGTILIVDAARVQRQRYWSPEAARRIVCRGSRDYADQFRAILQSAIDCRQGDACLMSGGLDSTSVALLAKVPTYSLTFPGRDCDESSYIEAVAQAGQWPSRCLTPSLPDEQDLDFLVARDRLPPLAPNYTMVEQLCGVAGREGYRHVLTGQGGDHAMLGSRMYYADLLQKGNGLGLFRALHRDFGGDVGRAWGEFRTSALYPLLPPAWLQTLRRWRRGPDEWQPPWLLSGFVSRVALADRLARPEGLVSHLPERVQRDYYRMVVGAEMAYSMESNDRCAAWSGVGMSHPFLDRRLLEFAFHIPPEQWLRGDETKGLLRRAMAGILPDSVRLRPDKAEFSSLVVATICGLPAGRWLENSLLDRHGWIDAHSLRRNYEALLGSDASLRLLGPVWEACSLEWWLRSEFGA